MDRRSFLGGLGGAMAGATGLCSAAAGRDGVAAASEIVIDPRPRFELSPHLYMQFMEPLGTTDGSVAAAWDAGRRCWREDVMRATCDLAPPMLRWGGCFSSYYKWREGVGPRRERVPMHNLLWGGIEDNQVGTIEFLDLCRQTGAEPLFCVNFESDGRTRWMRDPDGRVRSGDAAEAAGWVSYCNRADDPLRRAHGLGAPCPVRHWQIGNETSYDRHGFDLETAARKTLEFARAMRRADSAISLIGWGDRGWAKRMIEVAGEHLRFIAFHHMFDPGGKESVLRDNEYRKDPARTWDQLMAAGRVHEAEMRRMREEVAGSGLGLALTECHLSLRGRNRCEVLSSWAAGVAMARVLNVQARNGDLLRIATAADFCGTRWQVNAMIIPTPSGEPYLQPAGRVMSLYRHHVGRDALAVTACPDDLDVTASRTADRLFLHVINTNRTRARQARLRVTGLETGDGRTFEIAAEPEFEIMQTCPRAFDPVERPLRAGRSLDIPAASVSAMEIALVTPSRG